MKQTELFLKTLKEAPKDEEALNAKLLSRAGFVSKVGAGIYSYFPIGLRVLFNIASLVREEMNAIGGREVLLPALHPKEYWTKTGRWEGFDALYKILAKEDREYALGATHEEIVVPLAKKNIQSYKDLPLYFYQIQTKFRDEPRAKSGLLRGREFLMKDLYSFHTDQDDLDTFYDIKIAPAYEKIFKRCGLDAIKTKASGGSFSKYSHEYQVATDAGEDIIFYCKSCRLALNKEIVENEQSCLTCSKGLQELKASEVGNIFKLGTKYSEPFDLLYQTREGEKKKVVMGCYGIGISRLMGVIVEVHNDARGIIWPKEIAPFGIHLLKFKGVQNDEAYNTFQARGVDVLYDDREDVSDGAKLVEADLIGIPWRVVVSERTLKEDKIEVKQRNQKESRLIPLKKFLEEMKI